MKMGGGKKKVILDYSAYWAQNELEIQHSEQSEANVGIHKEGIRTDKGRN